MRPAWPKFFQLLHAYDRRTILSDLAAGVTVGLVALPLSMAFSIASGLPPQAGIYCAIVTGFLISLLGGSRTQIGGPTGAFVVVVAGIVAEHGIQGLFMCTMMAGVMLAVMGLTGLGSTVRFIPRPIVIGFTNGIALLIASTQIKDFFGIQVEKVPGEFLHRIETLLEHAGTARPVETALGAASLAVILLCVRLLPRVPGAILALAGGTAAVALLALPVETVGSRFGGVPSGLPSIHLPGFKPSLFIKLLMPALTVAMLGAIESLLSAVVADSMCAAKGIRDKHNPNTELFAQGVANIISPMFGGLPATGAIARTATSIRSGARTPLAGMIHAITLLAVLLAAAPLARSIPMATLAAILFVVAWNMGEWREFTRLKTYRLPYRVTLVSVFLLTVIFDLTVAVEFGIFAACLTFIYRISSLSRAERIDAADMPVLAGHDGQVQVWRLYGALFFGATKLLEAMEDHLPARALVLDLKNVIYVDSTGAEALEHLSHACATRGVRLIVSGLISQPLDIARRTGLYERLRPDLQPDVASAAAAAVA